METLRKIAELIEMTKTLEQRNEELKNIIVANLYQSNPKTDSHFSESPDFSDAKNLLVKFYQYNKIPSALFTDKGKLLCSVGWKNVPTHQNLADYFIEFEQFRNNHPVLEPNQSPSSYFFCLNSGFHAVAIPVEIKKKEIAILLLSQFLLKEKSSESIFLEKNSECLHAKENSTIPWNIIPVITFYEIGMITSNAILLTDMIAFACLKNMELHAHLRKQSDSNVLLSALLDKVSEQEYIIKTLLRNICIHHEEIKENTISKPVFQKQQRKLIDKIEKVENILNSLLTSVPLGIGFVRKNVFTYVNDQMFHILGYTPKDLIGRDPQMLFVSPGDIKSIFNLDPENFVFKDKSSFETLAVKKDGSVIDVMIFLSLMDGQNPEQGIAISIMDISSIKETQKELIRAKDKAEESDRLKSAFLDNMSHEFRTPMNAILGFTGLIVSPYITQKQKDDYLKIIHSNGRKLLRIIDDIIDLSKMVSNQLELYHKSFSVHQMMSQLYTDFSEFVTNKHGDAVKLILSEPDDNQHISLVNDEIRLNQILRNLLSNSLKFTSQGVIRFGYVFEEDFIQFYVEDTGKGIKKNQLKYIFERFRQIDYSITREHGGTGLGLSLAKGLVEMMGGKIWVESKWGKGSTFYFTLPLNTDNPNESVKSLDFKSNHSTLD